MLDSLDQVPWTTWPQPEWNGPGTVPSSLRRLGAASSEESARRASDAVLYALGNNHAGTYFPIALPAIPFLAELLREGTLLVRAATLEVLVDLVGSFQPAPGYEVFDGNPLERSVKAAVARLRPEVRGCAREGSPGTPIVSLATQLLELLDEP